MHILRQQFQHHFFEFFLHHVSVVVQAAQAGFTIGTPLFMGLNAIRKQGHCVSMSAQCALSWRH